MTATTPAALAPLPTEVAREIELYVDLALDCQMGWAPVIRYADGVTLDLQKAGVIDGWQRAAVLSYVRSF